MARPFDRFRSSNRANPISIYLEEFELSSQTQTKSLVSTDWLAEHANDKDVRVVEVDVDPTVYEKGHIDGTAGRNWKKHPPPPLPPNLTPNQTPHHQLPHHPRS